MREGIHVTTTIGVTQETYEMDPRDRPFDGTVSVDGTGATGITRKITDDGISFRSDVISGSDGGVEDGPGNRRKLVDEETRPASTQFPAPPRAVRPNYQPPYVGMLGPAGPPVASVAASRF
jgi:hypothetical protein